MTKLEDTTSGEPLALSSNAVLCLPVAAYDAGGEVRIESVKQRDGSTLWAVRRGPSCLSIDGQWEYEPLPSSRDAAFFTRCRYDTPHAALDVLDAKRRERPNVRANLDPTAAPKHE